jgi:hypothetical protein
MSRLEIMRYDMLTAIAVSGFALTAGRYVSAD